MMFKVDGKKIINACCQRVTHAMLHAVLIQSGLKWYMNPAQLMSIEHDAYMDSVENATVVSKVADATDIKMMETPTSHTLFGLPIELDDTLPNTWVVLALGNQEIFKIEGLAVPVGFPY